MMPDRGPNPSSDPPPVALDDTARYEHGLPPAAGPSDTHRSLAGTLPTELPGFELDGEIGRGGAGVVFRARQEKLGRVVAVKMLRRADLDEPRELARFITEAEAAAAVDHPNVIHVYEYGEHEGRPYLVLEYCGGGTLAQRLRREPRMAPAAAATLGAAIADGVHTVHSAGIVHRDLKPGNILFDDAGRPKVGDFGLAKRQGSRSDLTRTQAVLGSPAYMSPEQARGGTKFVGPGADIWALGVVLYECLAGGPPFTGPDPLAVLRKVTEDDPPPLRRLAPPVPTDLALIVHKCLAKEPADRYPTAEDLAADLRAFAGGQPVSARETGTAFRVGRWAKRHPGAAALWGGLLASLLVGAATSTWLAVRYRAQQRETARALAAVTAERRGTWDALNALTDQTVERMLARQPSLTGSDRRFLENILAQYERAVQRYDDSPDARRLIAHGQFRVARLRQRLGEVAAAEAGYRAGLDGFRAALALDPADAHAAAGVADCLEQLGWLLSSVGRLGEAEGAAREAVAARRPLGDPVRLGKTHDTLGLILAEAGRTAEAVAEYRVALDCLLPTAASNRRAVARVRVNLATALERSPADAAAAEAVSRAAVADYAAILAGDPEPAPDRLAAARAHINLGRLLARRGERAAVAELTAGVELARGLANEYPVYPDHQHELGRGLTLWAAVEPDPAAARRRLDEAATHHRRAMAAKPDGKHYKAAFAENRRLAAGRAADRGDHAAVAELADQFAAASPDRRREAATLLTRAARVVRWDVRLTPAERATLAGRYAAKAAGYARAADRLP